ncbi:hypothetical protein KAU92_01040 [Candidatus Bathyarchaeota archaeon]|nr:hypothetical protein [Candidatus Bathyarchaeota archaeon]
MGKDNVALAICLCLIVVVAGFSGFLYSAAKGLESKVSDLESRTSDLETENAELNEKVQNLTDWRDALMSSLDFTFIATEELKITNMEFITGYNSINVTMQNIGTSPITVTAIHISNGDNLLSSPVTVEANSQVEQQVSETGLWSDGYNYQIKIVTSRGNQYYYNAVAPSS